MAGEVSPEFLKGSSLGTLSNKKRGMAIFWDIKIYRRFYIGERMYRGKNQDYYISGEILSSILNRHGRGGTPECLKRVFFGDPFHHEKGHGFLLGY